MITVFTYKPISAISRGQETPEVDDEDIEENEFKTDSENETDGE